MQRIFSTLSPWAIVSRQPRSRFTSRFSSRFRRRQIRWEASGRDRWVIRGFRTRIAMKRSELDREQTANIRRITDRAKRPRQLIKQTGTCLSSYLYGRAVPYFFALLFPSFSLYFDGCVSIRSIQVTGNLAIGARAAQSFVLSIPVTARSYSKPGKPVTEE